MPLTEARARANEKYQKATLTRVVIKINKNTQADILEWLTSKENKQGYIIDLIRKDMIDSKGE